MTTKRLFSKCNTMLLLSIALLTGIESAHAANVATYGDVNPGQLPAPHTGMAVSLADIESGALGGYDVFWIGHAALSPGQWSASACTALDTFLSSGGGIVTEWNGLTMLFDSIEPGTYLPMDLPQCEFFTGSVGQGGFVGGSTPIDIIDPASPLIAGLSDPFHMSSGSEFFYTTGIDMNVWDVAAEFTAFGGTWPAIMSSDALGGIVVVGVMDYQDVLPGNANASTLLDNMIAFADTGSSTDRPVRAYFNVTKMFEDGFDAQVDVQITCNSGLPLQQEFTITGGDPDGVTFIVMDFVQGTSCTVTETSGPDGYTPVYNDGAGCTFDNIDSVSYSCAITNETLPGSFTVTAVWDLDGPDVEPVDNAEVHIICDADNGGQYDGVNDVWVVMAYLDNGESTTVTVDTSDGEASCWADPQPILESGVEISNGCSLTTVSPGESEECEITYTLFFEGIPTLSQWGMVVMALLLVGAGLVGFRRFV